MLSASHARTTAAAGASRRGGHAAAVGAPHRFCGLGSSSSTGAAAARRSKHVARAGWDLGRFAKTVLFFNDPLKLIGGLFSGSSGAQPAGAEVRALANGSLSLFCAALQSHCTAVPYCGGRSTSAGAHAPPPSSSSTAAPCVQPPPHYHNQRRINHTTGCDPAADQRAPGSRWCSGPRRGAGDR